MKLPQVPIYVLCSVIIGFNPSKLDKANATLVDLDTRLPRHLISIVSIKRHLDATQSDFFEIIFDFSSINLSCLGGLVIAW